MSSTGWKGELIECSLCPCRFFTDKDFEAHMDNFGEDPAEHLQRFMKGKNLSPVNKRDMHVKYLSS